MSSRELPGEGELLRLAGTVRCKLDPGRITRALDGLGAVRVALAAAGCPADVLCITGWFGTVDGELSEPPHGGPDPPRVINAPLWGFWWD